MEVVLHKKHRGEWKMVGKIFLAGATLILLHEESGSQRLHKLDAPGGLDVDAVDFAQVMGVKEVHHRRRGEDSVLSASLLELRTYGIRERMDGRDRIFLPRAAWTKRRLTYRIPYITSIKRIGEDALAPSWRPIADPTREPEGPPRLPGL